MASRDIHEEPRKILKSATDALLTPTSSHKQKLEGLLAYKTCLEKADLDELVLLMNPAALNGAAHFSLRSDSSELSQAASLTVSLSF